MNKLLRIVWLLVLVFIAFAISSTVSFYWVKFAVSKITFSTIFQFIEPLHFFIWLPDIIFYAIIGKFLFYKKSNYFWLFCFFVFVLEVYFVNFGFAGNSLLRTKVWAYMGYIIPIFSLLIGNQFSEKKTSIETTSSSLWLQHFRS